MQILFNISYDFFLGGGIHLFLEQPQSHTDHIPIVFDRHPYY